jgi:hypothetical protein
MDGSIASKSIPLSEGSTGFYPLPLARLGPLILILVLSLGLWAVIIAAIASLASVVTG